MEPNGLVYAMVDVAGARPILENMNIRGLDSGDKQFRRMLESTTSAIAAVYPVVNAEGEPAGSRFRLAASGRYPSGWARLALNGGKEWKGTKSAASGERFWSSASAMISVAISRREARLSGFMNGEPVDPFHSGAAAEVPEGFSGFAFGAAVSCWLGEPGTFINQRLAEMLIPIEIPADQVFAGIFPVPHSQSREPQYELHLRLRVSSEIQANGFARVITTARAFFAPPPDDGSGAGALASLLFANPIVAEGRHLNIRTEAMGAAEVATLLGMFAP